ncbi:MAG: radical SAM protein [Candidatus Omnitrophota bacterium]|jgi:putative pyruvate formate lyase activating enzyme
MYPAYLESYNNGKLARLVEEAYGLLESCRICPRLCKVNRLKDEKGFCKTGQRIRVCSFMAHHGEEPPISGERGSGAVFFSGCNMACSYCQNFEFSQSGEGKEVEPKVLAGFMLQLQNNGCHNINLVTPTHIMPQILKALAIAIPGGLNIPLVYNTGGYELPEMIRLLEGIVDIYLPDMRYAGNQEALKYSCAPDYPKYNQEALKEMHRQVGTARIGANGIIKRGLVIRHLVLPENISGTTKIMKFIAEELSKDTYISLMSQYSPYYKAKALEGLARRVTAKEYESAKNAMEKYGLHNGWTQEDGGLERFAGTNIKPI